jgi:FtsH-binding integral membrane protein
VEDRIDLAPGEGGAWSRTIMAPVFLWLSIALIAVGIAIYGTSVANGESDSFFGLIVIAVVSVVVALFSRFRVTVDWRGLRVVSSMLRMPLKRIRLEKIQTVEAGELAPSE